MRGLIALNFIAGAVAVVMAAIFWATNGLEISTTVVFAYAIGLGLLLVSAGLWFYRRHTMNRAYAVATQRTVSNNYLRRRARGTKDPNTRWKSRLRAGTIASLWSGFGTSRFDSGLSSGTSTSIAGPPMALAG